ncbi:MAG: hypothetical protein ACYDC1_05485 [Limisphaerales bacterium]
MKTPQIMAALLLGLMAIGCQTPASTRCQAPCTCRGVDCRLDHAHCPRRLTVPATEPLNCRVHCWGICISPVEHTDRHRCSHGSHSF